MVIAFCDNIYEEPLFQFGPLPLAGDFVLDIIILGLLKALTHCKLEVNVNGPNFICPVGEFQTHPAECGIEKSGYNI